MLSSTRYVIPSFGCASPDDQIIHALKTLVGSDDRVEEMCNSGDLRYDFEKWKLVYRNGGLLIVVGDDETPLDQQSLAFVKDDIDKLFNLSTLVQEQKAAEAALTKVKVLSQLI